MSFHEVAEDHQDSAGFAAGYVMQDDEKICRYCFDGEDDGELISPCNCAGGSRVVTESLWVQGPRSAYPIKAQHMLIQVRSDHLGPAFADTGAKFSMADLQ